MNNFESPTLIAHTEREHILVNGTRGGLWTRVLRCAFYDTKVWALCWPMLFTPPPWYLPYCPALPYMTIQCRAFCIKNICICKTFLRCVFYDTKVWALCCLTLFTPPPWYLPNCPALLQIAILCLTFSFETIYTIAMGCHCPFFRELLEQFLYAANFYNLSSKTMMVWWRSGWVILSEYSYIWSTGHIFSFSSFVHCSIT